MRLLASARRQRDLAFDDEAVAVTRKFTRLKAQLMPYLYQAAKQAHTDGTPTMRSMWLEFPEDRNTLGIETQYMLGSDLLVAPVFSAAGVVEFYLPQGEWVNFFTGEREQGGRWLTQTHGFDSLPLYVRAGATLRLGREDTFDYDFETEYHERTF